jgi:hypothetical protein
MLVLLITDSNSHFFDDANVIPTDILMLRRSTDDLSNVSDTDGNVPDKVIIDAEANVDFQRYVDLAKTLKDDAEIIYRISGVNRIATRNLFIEMLEIILGKRGM